MKAKKINLIAIGILIAICMITLIAVAFVESPIITVAYAADSSVNFDEYTDSDTLRNGTKTIRDYANSLHHSTVSINDFILSVTTDTNK